MVVNGRPRAMEGHLSTNGGWPNREAGRLTKEDGHWRRWVVNLTEECGWPDAGDLLIWRRLAFYLAKEGCRAYGGGWSTAGGVWSTWRRRVVNWRGGCWIWRWRVLAPKYEEDCCVGGGSFSATQEGVCCDGGRNLMWWRMNVFVAGEGGYYSGRMR